MHALQETNDIIQQIHLIIINTMLSKQELSQGQKSEETKNLLRGDFAYLMKNALRSTLNTVLFSSNLTPFFSFLVKKDTTDNALLRPVDDKMSGQWPFFLLNRTISHAPYEKKSLASTYKKCSKTTNWQPVLKIVDIKRIVYFEDMEKQTLFKNLGSCQYNFVCDNIQARNERSGNCIILTQVLAYFLWSQAIKSGDKLIKRIEIVQFKSLDHVFVIINRDVNSLLSDYKTWKGWIIDPWRGVKGKASIIHTDDFISYYENLRYYRPDIIYPDTPSSFDVEVFSSITSINLPKNIILFHKLDELIRHGRMELLAENNSCNQEDIAIHKSRFFAVRKEIESFLPKNDSRNVGSNVYSP